MTALRLVKERHPDLIVLDAMLPGVHGFEIARRIKGSQRYGQIPIIMVSAVYRGWRYAEDLKQSCGVEHFIEEALSHCRSDGRGGWRLPAQAATPAEAPDVSGEAEAALNAGVEAYKAGRLDEAIKHLQAPDYESPSDPLAYRLHFHLGLLYAKKRSRVQRGQPARNGRRYELAPLSGRQRTWRSCTRRPVFVIKRCQREMWERALAIAPDDETRKTIREHLLNLL